MGHCEFPVHRRKLLRAFSRKAERLAVLSSIVDAGFEKGLPCVGVVSSSCVFRLARQKMLLFVRVGCRGRPPRTFLVVVALAAPR